MNIDNIDDDLKNKDNETLNNNDINQNETENTQEVINKLIDQLTASEDRYKRLYADFENLRKRSAKEKLDLIYSANENILKNLLSIIDDFERAISAAIETKENENLYLGTKLIYSKIISMLNQFHVKEMTINNGDIFNADLHEAITSIPATDPNMKGKIIEVIGKGYFLNEKVLRFAKVILGE